MEAALGVSGGVARLKETKEYICTGVPSEKSRADSFYGGYSPPFGKCREL